MSVDGRDEWLSLNAAARAFDNGFVHVDFGFFVIDAVDTIPRNITDEDRAKISDASDEISANK